MVACALLFMGLVVPIILASISVAVSPRGSSSWIFGVCVLSVVGFLVLVCLIALLVHVNTTTEEEFQEHQSREVDSRV